MIPTNTCATYKDEEVCKGCLSRLELAEGEGQNVGKQHSGRHVHKVEKYHCDNGASCQKCVHLWTTHHQCAKEDHKLFLVQVSRTLATFRAFQVDIHILCVS